MAPSRRTQLLSVAVAGLLLTGVAAAGTARPGIALDQRIGPAHIGEPRAEIAKDAGPGTSVRLDGKRLWFYPKAAIYVSFAPGPHTRASQVAFWILTKSARYKTRSGVGVGSSLRRLRRGVTVRCYPGNPIVCQHERANTNLPFTLFDIDPGTKRVTSVAMVPGGD